MEPQEMILGWCAVIITVSTALNWIITWYGKAKAPTTKQDERITKLEARMDEVNKKLDNDNKRLNKLEEDYKMIIKSLLAIMSAITNPTESTELLDRTQSEIRDYLISK